MEALVFNRISAEVADSLNYRRAVRGAHPSPYEGLFKAVQDGPVMLPVRPGVDPNKFADRITSGLYKLAKAEGKACRIRLLADCSAVVVSLKEPKN